MNRAKRFGHKFCSRGQVSLELFFAFSLTLLVFFWMSNYLNVFYSTNAQSQSASEARLAARSLAMLANRACASNSSIELALPCIVEGKDPVFYGMNSTQNNLSVHFLNRPFVSTVSAVCELNTAALSSGGNLRFSACDALNYSNTQKLCISPQGGKVKFELAKCG